MSLLILAIGLLGLAVGSFLNVVIHRVPAAQSVVRPASACPSCGHTIRARHNVPVLSWILLRGRCADCSANISVRYPLVELLTAGLFVAVTIELHRRDQLALAPAFLFFTAIGIALSMIDLDVYRLPNAIVIPAYPVLATLLVAGAVALGDGQVLLRAAVGAAALTAGYFAIALAYPGGMGFGDVKLAGLVGAVLGALSYQALVVGAFAAFVIGAVVGLTVIALRRGNRRSAVPFGPFMVVGSLVALFVGDPVADTYSRLVLRA
jgi:leader peptidase (prepilin peptidase)/N-methyltransferase